MIVKLFSRTLSLSLEDERSFAKYLGGSVPLALSRTVGYFPAMAAYLLPDSRAGVLRLKEPLSQALLTVKWTKLSISAVDRELFRLMASLSEGVKDKEVSRACDFLDKELKFRFLIKPSGTMVIFDERRGLEVPLERAPSGLKELAPLALVIRHVLEKGDILMIEEPEAHLHPDAQSAVTRALAVLAKSGATVVATTHSVHVLDEVSHLVRLSSLSGDERRKLGYEKWEGLAPEEVAIYTMDFEGSTRAVKVMREGVSETDMDRILIEMANKYAASTDKLRARE